MGKILQSKTTLIIVLVLLGVFLLYQFVFKKDPADDFAIQETTFNPADVIIGRELLALLARMRITKIDTTLFDSAVWDSLVDYSEPIADQPKERVNPFAPIGVEKFGTTTTPKIKSSVQSNSDELDFGAFPEF